MEVKNNAAPLAINEIGGGYTVTAIKVYPGHEGEPCLYGKVCFKGKTIGTFAEDSYGGPTRLDVPEAHRQPLAVACMAHPEGVSFMSGMLEILKNQDKGGTSESESAMSLLEFQRTEGVECVVSSIASNVDLMKRQTAELKRWCKTKIVLKLPTAAEGSYTTYKIKYDPATHDAWLEKKHPGCIILNKQYG